MCKSTLGMAKIEVYGSKPLSVRGITTAFILKI